MRPILLIAILLLVPVLPLLIMGGAVDGWIAGWERRFPSPPATAAVVVGLLAGDILLPVPSSVVGAVAGWRLGAVGGTLAVWGGLSLGATIGFALARRWGRPFALWFTKEADLERAAALSQRLGPGILVLTRALPVLAEASVLFVGMHGLSWRRFLPPVLLSNLGLAIAYAALGQVADQQQWLPAALAIAAALPLVATAAVVHWLRRTKGSD